MKQFSQITYHCLSYHFFYFSRILERHIYDRLTEFINEKELLNNISLVSKRERPQVWPSWLWLIKTFRPGRMQHWYFLDFSKAPDTVDHDIIFAKANYMVYKTSCSIFFLSNRARYVTYNDKRSMRYIIKDALHKDPCLALSCFWCITMIYIKCQHFACLFHLMMIQIIHYM